MVPGFSQRIIFKTVTALNEQPSLRSLEPVEWSASPGGGGGGGEGGSVQQSIFCRSEGILIGPG